ncbi:hypothetical protein DID99_32155 [Burkholderia sp. Bp8986]|nr:hypothetical protein DIE01_26120 [Burkholderia sp. Bp8990]RQS46474.1 hypothetical protein DID99_32155 [Burkholderia sp. Bp8986]RQZ45376.1 hypothetical protein DIE17_21920 [Burkholderia sp. Bp9099]
MTRARAARLRRFDADDPLTVSRATLAAHAWSNALVEPASTACNHGQHAARRKTGYDAPTYVHAD